MLTMKEGNMRSIEILSTGNYLPSQKIENKELEEKWNLEKGYIQKRSGIQSRYYCANETLEDMAYQACLNCMKRMPIPKEKIGGVIVASTTNQKSMPGLAFSLQKKLEIPNGFCLDLSAGCNGFINALDLAKSYITLERAEYFLVVGVDLLSKIVEESDYALKMLLADGAGAVLVGKSETEKKYQVQIESRVEGAESLCYSFGDFLKMDGIAIYKYAVAEGSRFLKEILEKEEMDLDEIRWVIPHQSNLKIMEAIASRVHLPKEKIYTNIQNVGNTFCASIPIALDENKKKKMWNKGDKIILLGYGGGLNTGCILMER